MEELFMRLNWVRSISDFVFNLSGRQNKIHNSLIHEASSYIDLEQIKYWENQYKKTKNIIQHPYIEIAQFFMNAGLHDNASKFYLQMLRVKKDKKIHSLYLQNLLLSASATNQTLSDAHQEWAKEYGQPKSIKWDKHVREPNKKLKIGYLCHFFGNSVSQNLLLPFLKLHDRNKFEVYCYDDGETPLEYQNCADHWIDIRGKTDEEVAKLVHHDAIDILQEVNGFCIINRFGALAYRPAPIQINWYNHTGTTGLSFVDYVVSDKISIQNSDLTYFTENAYRSDEFIAAVNFDHTKFSEPPLDPPCIQKGFITFGYFGGSHKITLKAIQIWSEILKQVPGSRFILKSGSFTHQIYRDIFKKHFANEGIDSDRVIFEGWSDQASTLKKYHEIDIMLDNVPVSGGSTMFEALLQSVPVISLMGERWAARSGASVLKTLKQTELIAESPESYIQKAVALAKDSTKIAQYKKILRHKMLASSLTDVEKCYQNFENAYQEMWQKWCHQNPHLTF